MFILVQVRASRTDAPSQTSLLGRCCLPSCERMGTAIRIIGHLVAVSNPICNAEDVVELTAAFANVHRHCVSKAQ